jgi:putative GTP pyrophosphokinase
VSDISDLVGFRIVVLFEGDIEGAALAAERLFKFQERKRTQLRLVPDQFGYASLHYCMSADWDWLHKIGLQPSQEVPVEVQIRTMAQHVWAAASHVLQYKSEDAVPPELRRGVSRLAAFDQLCQVFSVELL